MLFNLVIHQKNVHTIPEMTRALYTLFPKAQINPFPAQSSMFGGKTIFDRETTPVLEKVLDWAISEHLKPEGPRPLTPRLQYFLMLKSVFETYGDDPVACARAMSGYGVWDCFDGVAASGTPCAGAARFVQVGASERPWTDTQDTSGLHLGCYWNQTVTIHESQIHMGTPNGAAEYIMGGINRAAVGVTVSKRCPACIMPRLTFDMFAQEIGMNRELQPAYLDLRKKFVGF